MSNIIKLILIIIVIAVASSLVTYALTGAFGSNPVKEAQQEATAAVIIAQMTPSPLPTASNMTPTLSYQEIALTQLSIQQTQGAEQQAREEAQRAEQQAREETLRLTEQANELALEREQLRVEQAAIRATNDERERVATAESDRLTASAMHDLQTASARDLLTQQAIQTAGANTMIALATEGAGTSIAATSTALIAPTTNALALQQAEIDLAIRQEELRQAELARERQEIKNMADAVLPWTLTVAVIGVLGVAIFIFLRVRTVETDERGYPKIIITRLANGRTLYTKPALMPAANTIVHKNGQVEVVDTPTQNAVTERAQIVEGIKALPPYLSGTGRKMLETMVGGKRADGRIIIGNGELKSDIEEADVRLLEDES